MAPLGHTLTIYPAQNLATIAGHPFDSFLPPFFFSEQGPKLGTLDAPNWVVKCERS